MLVSQCATDQSTGTLYPLQCATVVEASHCSHMTDFQLCQIKCNNDLWTSVEYLAYATLLAVGRYQFQKQTYNVACHTVVLLGGFLEKNCYGGFFYPHEEDTI